MQNPCKSHTLALQVEKPSESEYKLFGTSPFIDFDKISFISLKKVIENLKSEK